MWLQCLDDINVLIVYFIVVLAPVWNSVIDNDLVKVMNRSTWHEGQGMCNNITGYFMASYDQFEADDSLLKVLSNLSATPIWLYAIEYRHNKNINYIRIQAKQRTKTAYVICKNESGDVFLKEANTTFKQAVKFCDGNESYVIDISRKTAYDYRLSNSLQNNSIWLRDVDITSYFEGNKSLTQVACLVLDENGEIKKDDCSKEHNVACLKGEVRPTLQYNPVEIPQYVPTTDGSSTSPTGTTAPSTDIISSSGGNTHSDKQDPNTHTTETNKREGFNMIFDQPYIIIAAASGGAVVLVFIIVCCCCCCCRKKNTEKGQGPQLSEVYSDAADSISMRQYDKKQTDYAIPEDAIRSQKARPRLSIGEDEYDTIQQTAKNKTLKPNANANVYSHVTVQNAQASYENHSNDTSDENPYDVTSYGGKNTVVVVAGTTSEQYGHVQINTLP